MTKLNIVHVALTPLAGSPIRIVNALKRHTDFKARLIVLNPRAYGLRCFEGDIDWVQHREEALTLLHQADLVHLHHFFDLKQNPFEVDFTRICPRAHFVRQFHTHPLTIARGDEDLAARIVESEMPQLVVAQFHERWYPRARLVPNIVPLDDDLYRPVTKSGSDPVLFFAPTIDNTAYTVPEKATRWETKGAPETERLLNRVVQSCGVGRVSIRRNIPHEQCLREKQTSDIAIDELITGSYHLSSLESLAQGIPTFAYLDSRTLHTIAELTGTHIHPWLNFCLEDAEAPLRELISDRKLRQEIGAFSRDWMEAYYSDREMVIHYVRAYEDVVEHPERFERLRFESNSPGQVFLAQRRDEMVWESRRSRILVEQRKPTQRACVSKVTHKGKSRSARNWIKTSVHKAVKKYTSVRVDELEDLQRRLNETENILAFVAADETNRWLYENRLERMDATLDIFESRRREFHLDRYRFAAQHTNGYRVLDCACGTGYGVRLLREWGGARQVVGIDCEFKAVEYARKKHQIRSTEFICSSGDKLALGDASVDVITSFETVEHVPDDGGLIEEFYRVLRPGGYLIISTPNQWPLADSPFHLREYDRASFLKVLEPRFKCLDLYNQNSGSESLHNHKQPRGILPTTLENERLAECYLAVCKRKVV